MSKIVRLLVSIPLAVVFYWCTLVGLGALIDMVSDLPPLRAVIGTLWVAAQPFAFGIFVFVAEAFVCYWLLGLVIKSKK